IEQDSSAATVTAQPTVNTTTPQPIIKKPAQQPILSSTDATKKIQQTPPKAQIKAVATPQQVTQPSTTTTNATPAATGTGNAVQGTSKQNGGSEQGTAQHNTPTTSSNTVAEPTRLNASQVTVLSIGQINYNDKALQNQNRLLILTLQIDSKGKPTQIRIKQSSGLDYLDQLVIKAAQKARFKPHIVNGQAVAVIVDYPFQLNLSQR
ncbi:energy transducer TonB, partial [Acinetobacter qingfengensis]